MKAKFSREIYVTSSKDFYTIHFSLIKKLSRIRRNRASYFSAGGGVPRGKGSLIPDASNHNITRILVLLCKLLSVCI